MLARAESWAHGCLTYLLTVWFSSLSLVPAAETRSPEFVVELGFHDRLPTGEYRYSTALGVTAEGAILVPQGATAELTVADRMLPQQLAGLVQELNQTGRLGEIHSSRLQQQLEQACRAAGFAAEIEGAAETVIRIRSENGVHEVRCAALSVMAARFPDMLTLQRLHVTQLRLQNIAAVAMAGGEQASGQLAETANRTLKIAHPDVAPLSPRDLAMVRRLATGSRYVQFYRLPVARGEQELLVSLFETPGTEPRVSVMLNPTQAAN